MLTKKENRAHLAIAALQRRFEKSNKKFTLVTQNIDRLHQKAGSINVIELHGTLWETKCSKCGQILENRDSPICPALDGLGAPDPKQTEAKVPLDKLPKCLSCGGLLRPNVVWFNEQLDALTLEKAFDAASESDVVLVIGTSSVVYPAALIAPKAAREGKTVCEFNIEETEATKKFGFMFKGKAGVIMPYVLEIPEDELYNKPTTTTTTTTSTS